MEESEDTPFRAEYAKSARSACKSCKEKIAKDELRMAAMVQSPMFDGKVPNWFHFRCFFAKYHVPSVGDVGHFANLRWEDQNRIKEKLGGTGATPGSAVKGKRKAKASSSVASNGGSSTDLKEFSVEYAKSSRASCRGCLQKIEKDVIRISKMDRDSDTAKRYGPNPGWYHWECFIEARGPLEYLESGEKLPGFLALNDLDQKTIQERIPKMAAVKEEVVTKRPKQDMKEEQKEELELQKQNKLVFKFRDQLSGLKKKDLADLLIHNEQEVPKGESKILERLSDILAFGCLSPCPECKQGQLVFSNKGYVCTGDLTEWTKCQYITKNPKRYPFQVPDDLGDEIAFLKHYKYKPKTRLFPKVDLSPTMVKTLPTTSGPSKKPLDYARVVYVGKLTGPPKEALKRKILSLGGKLVTQVDDTTTFVISNEEEVKKMSKKMREAKEEGVQVVPESFLDELDVKDTLGPLLTSKNIATWDGNDPELRLKAAKALEPTPSLATGSGVQGKSSVSKYGSGKSGKVKLTIKGGAAVDPESQLEDRSHVLLIGKTPLTSTLGMVDAVRNTNSFYKLQVLESDVGNHYWFFRAWGRVGTTIGGSKTEEFDNALDAVAEFQRLFEEKTGNVWKDRERFQKKPNRMVPLDIDYGQDSEVAEVKLAPTKNCNLPKPIQELICLIFDVEKMKSALIEFEVDLEKMPLGKLSKGQIEKAYRVLTELLKLIKDGGSNTKLLDATNRFYTLVPHNFGLAKPPLLDQESAIKAKIEMLDALKEIEIAYSLLQVKSEGQDPVQSHYLQLNSKMEVLEPDSDEFGTLKRYVENTHAATHSSYELEIQDIFKVVRVGEEKKFKPFKSLPNRKLLWHGSRTTNYVGILSQGLRIAPPEAPPTGYMFGKGVYFADMVSKSANYCFANKTNPTGLLLLCDVALGNMYELTQAQYMEKLPRATHSTKGVGKTCPDPALTAQTKDGAIIPLGKPIPGPIKDTSLLYNEYIVYDTAQVNIKYLLKLNFKFKF